MEWTPKEHSRTSQTWERRMRSCVRRSAGTARGAPPLLGRNPEGRWEKGLGENLLAFLLGLGVRWLATSASMLRVDSSPTATAALGVRVPPCDHMHRLRKRVTNVSVHRFESGHNWIRIQTINFYLYGAKSHPKTSQGALDNQKKTNSLIDWMNKKRLYLSAKRCHLPRCSWPPHLASLSPCPWCSWSPAASEAWACPAWWHNLFWVCQPPNQAWLK